MYDNSILIRHLLREGGFIIMKRKLTSLLLCGALAASMMAVPAAAESTSDLSGELTLLHYLTEDAKLQALDDLIAGFEAENPNVTVNAEAVSYDNYLDVIKLRLSSGDAPDIMFGGPGTYPELVNAGYIMDLSDKDYISRVSEGSLSLQKLDDKVYAVPLDQMANVVFYNKDIFNDLGLTVPTT